jgi:hypothetical protein
MLEAEIDPGPIRLQPIGECRLVAGHASALFHGKKTRGRRNNRKI